MRGRGSVGIEPALEKLTDWLRSDFPAIVIDGKGTWDKNQQPHGFGAESE